MAISSKVPDTKNFPATCVPLPIPEVTIIVIAAKAEAIPNTSEIGFFRGEDERASSPKARSLATGILACFRIVSQIELSEMTMPIAAPSTRGARSSKARARVPRCALLRDACRWRYVPVVRR